MLADDSPIPDPHGQEVGQAYCRGSNTIQAALAL